MTCNICGKNFLTELNQCGICGIEGCDDCIIYPNDGIHEYSLCDSCLKDSRIEDLKNKLKLEHEKLGIAVLLCKNVSDILLCETICLHKNIGCNHNCIEQIFAYIDGKVII